MFAATACSIFRSKGRARPEIDDSRGRKRGEFAALPLHDKQGSLAATLVLCTHRDRQLSAAARRVLSALNDAMIEAVELG